jgi:hypothetical protein
MGNRGRNGPPAHPCLSCGGCRPQPVDYSPAEAVPGILTCVGQAVVDDSDLRCGDRCRYLFHHQDVFSPRSEQRAKHGPDKQEDEEVNQAGGKQSNRPLFVRQSSHGSSPVRWLVFPPALEFSPSRRSTPLASALGHLTCNTLRCFRSVRRGAGPGSR